MRELFVQLAERTLRFDGVSLLHPEQVEHFLLRGLKPSQIRVTELTEELEHFNLHVSAQDQISDAWCEPISFNMAWQLPKKYLELDVEQHVLIVFGERLPGLAYDHTQTEAAITRVAQELQEFEQRGLFNMLRVIVYILDRFKETGVVYGVGRGSSCASFVLFLLGLHVVDPIRFNVPLEEFIHA